jgi:hypothetical protein
MDIAQCTPSCDVTTLSVELHGLELGIAKCTQKTDMNLKNLNNNEHYVHKCTQQSR